VILVCTVSFDHAITSREHNLSCQHADTVDVQHVFDALHEPVCLPTGPRLAVSLSEGSMGLNVLSMIAYAVYKGIADAEDPCGTLHALRHAVSTSTASFNRRHTHCGEQRRDNCVGVLVNFVY